MLIDELDSLGSDPWNVTIAGYRAVRKLGKPSNKIEYDFYTISLIFIGNFTVSLLPVPYDIQRVIVRGKNS